VTVSSVLGAEPLVDWDCAVSAPSRACTDADGKLLGPVSCEGIGTLPAAKLAETMA
jgi:hypothetical protein